MRGIRETEVSYLGACLVEPKARERSGEAFWSGLEGGVFWFSFGVLCAFGGVL